MTEEERKQEAFREEMRGYISADKKALESLAERVTQLEKTVIHGNGNPPLVSQIASLQAKWWNVLFRSLRNSWRTR